MNSDGTVKLGIFTIFVFLLFLRDFGNARKFEKTLAGEEELGTAYILYLI
jgi:hypothetical protein